MGRFVAPAVEGTGSFGAGLTRALRLEGIEVVEVTRAARVGGRHRGKNDTRDAEAAARCVLSGQATAEPKARDGIVESIRVLRNTRASAVKARTQAILHIKNLLVTAPDPRREALGDLTNRQLVDKCARMHRSSRRDSLNTTRQALRSLARRHQALDGEIAELDAVLLELTRKAAPRLLNEAGVGPEIAARMLLVAGDNTTACATTPPSPRCAAPARSKPPAARSCATASTAAATAKATAVMADRQQPHDPPPQTRDYVKRRTAEGKTTKEIRRCLMRHMARGIYPLLIAGLTDAQSLPALT